jgi:MFS family permease
MDSLSMPVGSTTTTMEYLTWSTPLSDEKHQALSRYRDPITWPTSSKVIVYGMSVLTTLMAAYSISAYVAGVDAMAAEFQSESIVVLIGMPSFQTGFAIGPMALAPLSEIHGRKPVFLGTYALFNGGIPTCGRP